MPLLDPQVGISVVGLRTFLTVWEFIWLNFSADCGSSAWQLYGEINGNLLQRAYATCCITQVWCTQSPCPCSRPLLTSGNTQTQFCLSFCGVSGSWCPQGFVLTLQASLAGIVFDSKCDFAPLTVLLGLLLCSWMWSIFFGQIQHSPVNGCSAASCNFGVLTGENGHTSFYSTILCFFL